MNLDRITRDQMLMGIAHTVAMRGTCSRAQVGAVIAKDHRVISMGYNGAPSGLDHCHHFAPYDASSGCTRAVHAEANAIVFAAREGIPTLGTTLYVTMSPCVACSRLVINAGIRSVYYTKQYRDTEGLKLMEQAGISTHWMGQDA